MPHVRDVPFTAEQRELLRQIHELARKMERIKNTGKVHAVIALIEELSADYIAESYLMEKINLLFSEW